MEGSLCPHIEYNTITHIHTSTHWPCPAWWPSWQRRTPSESGIQGCNTTQRQWAGDLKPSRAHVFIQTVICKTLRSALEQGMQRIHGYGVISGVLVTTGPIKLTHLRCLSMLAALSNMAVGLAMFLPTAWAKGWRAPWKRKDTGNEARQQADSTRTELSNQ